MINRAIQAVLKLSNSGWNKDNVFLPASAWRCLKIRIFIGFSLCTVIVFLCLFVRLSGANAFLCPEIKRTELITVFDQQNNNMDAGENASVCSWEAVEERGTGSGASSANNSCNGDGSSKVLWVPDHAVSKCTGCSIDFWIGRRKHHCRWVLENSPYWDFLCDYYMEWSAYCCFCLQFMWEDLLFWLFRVLCAAARRKPIQSCAIVWALLSRCHHQTTSNYCLFN